MQVRPHIAVLLLTAFIVAAVFGLYLPMMGHAGHDVGCAFSPPGTALCSAPVAHLEHWQAAFTAVLGVILVLLSVLVLVFFRRHDLFDPDVGVYETHVVLDRAGARPPLLQELFSNGILNRKEAYSFVV